MKQKRLLFLARAAMTLLLVMLCSLGTWAYGTINVGGKDYTLFTGGYTADAYSSPNNYNASNANENYTKLVDGNTGTKWCVVRQSIYGWSTIYVDFHTANPIVPKGYVLTTGGDTETNPNRNPKTWKLYGKAKLADDWTEIDSRDIEANAEDAMPAANTTAKTFSMTSNATTYYYYRFEVNTIVGKSGNDWTFQLAELQLFGNVDEEANKSLEYATVTGITTPYYIYTGSTIAVNYTVKDIAGNTLTKGTDYTESFSPSPVQEAGEYTLTITGKGSYTGSKVINFEVRRTLAGSGTAADPYLIGSDLDWETFVNWINNENSTYRSKYYKLTADINVSTMAGTSNSVYFGGTFDGDGHTMTLNLTATGDYCGPFRYASYAKFKRLHVTGTINSAYREVGGIVGYFYYTNGTSFANCWSSVTINSTYTSATNISGGFVGYNYSTVSYVNCLFDGSFLGSDSYGFGGFSGCLDYSSNFTNCLFAPTSVNVKTNDCKTFARKNSSAITNCYYTETLGTEQGTAVGSMTNAELQQALGNGWEIKNSKVVPVQDLKNLTAGTLTCNTFIPYTGSEITLTPTIKDMDGNTIAAENYSISYSPSPVQALGNYTMTVSGNANGYSGTLTHQFQVANQLAGTGTSGDPYLIGTTDDWNTLAAAVAGGISYSGKYVKLTADITVSTMVGVANNFPFSGTFDGNNKTITANIVSAATGDDVNIQGVAPFHYINGARIKNLTVAGTVTSASKYAAGLVGWSTNYPHFDDCVVTATITTSADYAGGFVGNIYANSNSTYTYFENCVFAGTINNTSSNADRNAGGFFGYGSGYSYFTNCLENGTYTNLTMMNPRGASNSYSNDNASSLCYFNKIGNVGKYITDDYGCHQVKNTIPTEDIYKAQTIHGYNFYQPVLLTGMYDTYAYNNGEEISLGYKLKMNSTTLTKDTDYEVAVSPAAPAAIGNYTITLSAKDGNAAGYAGSTVRSFRVMEGESLDGYVFAKDGDDYLINDESDLERLAAYVNSDKSHTAEGKTFKLKANITMTAAHTPIGGYLTDGDHWFKGTIDGNNKTITNLFSDNLTIYQGLIGVAGGVIKDLTLANCNINGGGSYTGGIAAYASSTTIQNCHVSGTITGKNNVGGIVGRSGGSNTITSCENTATISGDGVNHGGIVGDDDSSSNKYSLCLNTGTVAGTNYVGGIAGDYYTSSNFTNCYYATPCTVKALNNWDSDGRAERGYIITAGDHISSIVAAEEGAVTSYFSGAKYYKKGNWTLTLTPDLTNATFIKYNCEGGTLTNLTTVGGTHTLTITNQDVTISAIVSSNNGVDMSTVDIAAIPDQRWKGNDPVIPALTVTKGGTPLVLDTDYLVEVTNNTAKGEATVTLTGINNYKGTKSVTFNIVDFPLLDPEKSNSDDNPYLIATEEDLEALAGIVNSGGRKNGYYKQTANIALTEEHTAIGTSSNYFQGTFDGDKKTISGLVINKPTADNQGLFGYASGATIKNVIINNCDITARQYVGAVVGKGESSTSISYCTVSGAIKTAAGVESFDVGGIAGYSYYIDHCVNTASVTGNGTNSRCYAGITGYAHSSISYCFNAGAVSGGTSYVGSITGQKGGSLTNNYHTAATIGGVGAENVTTGTDQDGAEVVVKITAGAGVTLNLPEKTYEWNSENLYKSGTVVTLNYDVPAGKVWDCYTVNSGEISNAGIKDGEHTLTGFSEDVVITGTYANEIINLATAGALIADIANLTYNGSEQHPVPVVTLASETLVEGANYTVSYEDGCTNAGTYTVTVTGIGRYTGSVSKTFTIDPFNVSGCDIVMENPLYTGSEIELNPTVKRNGTLLVKGADKDYVITTVPAEVLAVGDYTMTITGKGNYTGTKDFDFQVLKRLKIGSGNSQSGNIPFHNWYNYALTQQIYTADEMGNQAGKIFNIDLRVNATDNCKRTMDVYLVNTSKSKFENTTDWIKVTDADKVFSGQVDFPQNDWATITLDTPFMYDGTSNLAIIFDVTRDSYHGDTYFNGPAFLVYKGGSNQTLNQYSDGTHLDPQSDITTGGTLYSSKNQVRLFINRHERITMNAHGIMTYASANTLDFSNVSGLTATYASEFASTSSSTGTLTMTPVTEVPATEGLMLRGTANETYYVPVMNDAAAPFSPTNLLVGLTEATLVNKKQTIAAEEYTTFILGKKNEHINWYVLSEDSYTLKANSAYLRLRSDLIATSALGITMDFGNGDVTDISSVSAETENEGEGWYTLGGLKLDQKPTAKGVYIHNGTKVVVK